MCLFVFGIVYETTKHKSPKQKCVDLYESSNDEKNIYEPKRVGERKSCGSVVLFFSSSW